MRSTHDREDCGTNAKAARGGMTVMPGNMVHMDMHGVVMFLTSKMKDVLASV